jgi:hypothetical protein
MVLDNSTIEKIKSLVYQKPRTINDIAIALGKNWRTANRYIEEIILKSGQIKVTTFREGTRGALKLVYWNNTDKIYSTDIQEKLFKQIESGIDKSDFSPFEIFQFVDSDKRNAYYEEIKDEKTYDYNIKSLIPLFENAKKEILIFAGNLAFIHLKYKKKKMFDYIKDCIDRKVIIKIMTKVNIIDLENIELLLSLNSGLKENLIEIRHEITPLRAYIFDNDILKLGELQLGQGKEGQIQNKIGIYYEITDENWIDWMQKLFWKKFQNSIVVNKRIENIRALRKIN